MQFKSFYGPRAKSSQILHLESYRENESSMAKMSVGQDTHRAQGFPGSHRRKQKRHFYLVHKESRSQGALALKLLKWPSFMRSQKTTGSPKVNKACRTFLVSSYWRLFLPCQLPSSLLLVIKNQNKTPTHWGLCVECESLCLSSLIGRKACLTEEKWKDKINKNQEGFMNTRN